MSFRFNQFDLDRMMRELGNAGSGVLGRLLADAHDSVRPSDFGLLGQKVERATDLAFRLQHQGRAFFQVMGDFAELLREGQPPNNYAWQARILPATRTQPGWDEVEVAWGVFDETWGLLLKLLAELHKTAADLYADGVDALEDVMSDIGNLYRRMAEADNNLNQMVSEPAAGQVYWIEIHPNGNRLTLNAAPLQVGPMLDKFLWQEKASVVLTSATLTTHSEFNYMRRNLGAADANEMMLGSPFDYESSTLLFLPSDMPEPNQQGYQPAMDRALVQLCTAVGGRTLVLFTSYAQLKRTSKSISGALAQADIAVYEQGEGASPNTLVESFKESERAVLLGTRSFWEGVDIPGEALSVVVIPKLPFDVPSDPLIAARSETYEDAFNEYYLPEAILKFRQGFGRLIRTQSDRGVVVILDKRLQTKQYGRLFVESLPQCTLKVAPLNNLARMAAQWLGV
jgi:DNA polymerase-3 subunit epsilon/ATP-dependent DNA helicase DinG